MGLWAETTILCGTKADGNTTHPLTLWLDQPGNTGYRFTAALLASVPVGMVATLGPAIGDGMATGCALAGAAALGVSPKCLRTLASIFASVSLFSLRNWRAFSRPCPMRSPS